MPDAPNLTKLKDYLTGLAQPHGFLVDVQISHDVELPGSNKEPHIQVSVHNMSKSPPITNHFYVRPAQFERGGVHVFDVYMEDAFRSLSAL